MQGGSGEGSRWERRLITKGHIFHYSPSTSGQASGFLELKDSPPSLDSHPLLPQSRRQYCPKLAPRPSALLTYITRHHRSNCSHTWGSSMHGTRRGGDTGLPSLPWGPACLGPVQSQEAAITTLERDQGLRARKGVAHLGGQILYKCPGRGC